MKYFCLFMLMGSTLLGLDQDAHVAPQKVRDELKTMKVGHKFGMHFLLRGYDEDWEVTEEGDMLPPMVPLIRTPSNGGLENLEPDQNATYMVSEITNRVPNSGAPRERLLIVRQSDPPQNPMQGIFWTINCITGQIESCEAGDYLAVITNVQPVQRGQKRKQ